MSGDDWDKYDKTVRNLYAVLQKMSWDYDIDPSLNSERGRSLQKSNRIKYKLEDSNGSDGAHSNSKSKKKRKGKSKRSSSKSKRNSISKSDGSSRSKSSRKKRKS